MTADAAAPHRAALSSPQRRWLLTVTVLGKSVALLDATVVNVALPEIGRDLDASFGRAAHGCGKLRRGPCVARRLCDGWPWFSPEAEEFHDHLRPH